jgi:hypothetical protein
MRKKQILKLLLAHHPLCENFAPDMIGNYRKWPICRGCAFFYPSLVLTLILGFCVDFFNTAIHYHFFIFLAIGAMALASFFLKPLISDMQQWLDDIIHILTGFGAGLIVVANLLQPFPVWFKIVILVNIDLAMVFATFFHSRKMDDICNNCEFHPMGKKCPGFTNLEIK